MNNYNWTRFGELPHISLMKKNDLKASDLSPGIQVEIKEFNVFFLKVLKDGFVDETEKEILLENSETINKQIIQQYEQKQSESNVSGLGVLAVVGLLIGGAFGVNQWLNR